MTGTHAAPTPLRKRYLTRLLRSAPAPVPDGEPGLTAAVLEELRELHRPFAIYERCDCPEYDHAEPCTYAGDFVTCLPPSYYICGHCCRDAEGIQSEECAADHPHGEGTPVCPTAAILDRAQ